jgi:serine/threonine protein kinase
MEKPVPPETAAWILFNICEGLKFAHSQKIIHRDLKPGNILLKSGVPKISDWGLSRVVDQSTSGTTASFSPSYAAPEQISGRTKDERTDIWQLGVILYELATGELPFTGESMVEIAVSISTKEPEPPGGIRAEAKTIEPVIMKCLEKDPVKRYQPVLELQKALGLFIRANYSESLKMSVTANDFRRSAFYCGDLVLINLQTGDIATAYRYISYLATYAEGEVKADAIELSEQLRTRMEQGISEVPDELIRKAEIIVHKMSLHFRKI